jgi:general secretion pathway protein F
VPIYAYKGVTGAGKTARGQVTAENARAARSKMRQDGVFLTEINEAAGSAGGAATTQDRDESTARRLNLKVSFGRRIPAIERAVATRQLATLVGAGIPLVEAMTALVQQLEHAYLKTVMGQARERVNEGASLADALEETEEFDKLYVSMIRAGEASGGLAPVLMRIADYLEETVRLTNKVGSILMYPAFMLLFTLVVVATLVTVVLPQITSLLASLDQELPFYTVWIMAGSEFARSWWWAMAMALVALYFGFRAIVATEAGRAGWDRMKLRMPIVGRIVRIVAIARFTRTLATLLSSGVGIIQSLDIARNVANNTVIANVIDDARNAVLEGAPLAVPLKNSGEFPPLVTTMVEVGERSGELEPMLDKVATTYDEQIETTVSGLTALLEPLLILVMVGIVLVIILATLMPLLQITNSLN